METVGGGNAGLAPAVRSFLSPVSRQTGVLYINAGDEPSIPERYPAISVATLPTRWSAEADPPTPPPARATDSDTGDPGTVRPGVPVYDKAVSRPRSCRHAPRTPVGKRCSTAREQSAKLGLNFRMNQLAGNSDRLINAASRTSRAPVRLVSRDT